MITMYTDGGCYNNGDRKGLGAFAFLSPTDDKNVLVYVQKVDNINNTNNRMEMLAAIEAIKSLRAVERDFQIISDSGYLVKGFHDSSYLDKWIANGWITSNKNPVQNKDLWTQLSAMRWHNNIRFKLIKGHKKDKNVTHAYWNDICDRACTYAMHELESEDLTCLIYNTEKKSFRLYKDKEVD